MKKLLLATFFLLLAACASPSDDLDAICDEVNTFKTQMEKGEGEYSELTPDRKMTVLAKKIDARIKSTEIRAAFGAVESAAPAEKYKLMQAAASEVGAENWQCPALQELWSPKQ